MGNDKRVCKKSDRLVILESRQHSRIGLQHADTLLQLANRVLKMKIICVVLLNGRLSHNGNRLPVNRKGPQQPLLKSYILTG